MISDSAIILARITYGTKIRNQRTSLHKIAKQLMDTFSAMQFLCSFNYTTNDGISSLTNLYLEKFFY